MRYTDVAGVTHQASILEIHVEDDGADPFYTILAGGEQRTTVGSRLRGYTSDSRSIAQATRTPPPRR